jgi:hypothetical protein
MRVQTRVYFAVRSDVLGLEELETRIGMRPTFVTRRASKRIDPPIPSVNAWNVDSALSPSVPLWKHLEALRELIEPVSGRIAELCQGEPTACLQIVREFFPDDGEADLGFWLDEQWLAIISRTGAHLDVDEYDYTADQDQVHNVDPLH